MRTNIILASLLALVGYWLGEARSRVEAQSQQFGYYQEQHDLIVSDFKENTRYNSQIIDWHLRNEKYEQLRVVQPVLAEVNDLIEVLFKAFDQVQSNSKRLHNDRLNNLIHLQEKTLNKVRGLRTDLLKNESKALILNEYFASQMLNYGEVTEQLKRIENIIKKYKSNRTSFEHASLLSICKSAWAIAQSNFAKELTSFIGSRGCYFDHPIGIYYTRSVEGTLSALLVFQGYTGYGNENLRVTVDGKLVYPDRYGVVEYEIAEDGKTREEVKYEALNLLTGETIEGRLWVGGQP